MRTADSYITELELAFNVKVIRSETCFSDEGWMPMAIELNEIQMRKFKQLFNLTGSYAGGNYNVVRNNTVVFNRMFGKDIQWFLSVCK